jgi:hypothetical protein
VIIARACHSFPCSGSTVVLAVPLLAVAPANAQTAGRASLNNKLLTSLPKLPIIKILN